MDVKPSNIFLTSQYQGAFPYPRVVLGDFGCSTTLEEMALGRSEPWICSWQDTNFEPPEAPEFNLRSDVFQIGLVLFCLMFVEDVPYEGCDYAKYVRNATSYTVWPRHLVCRCLERDAARRISAEELLWTIGLYKEMGLQPLVC